MGSYNNIFETQESQPLFMFIILIKTAQQSNEIIILSQTELTQFILTDINQYA